MRQISLLILITICISLFSAGVPLQSFASADAASLHTLDVCHTTAPVVNPDLPYISVSPCRPLHMQPTAVYIPLKTTFDPLIVAFQDERPPKPLI